MNNSKSVAESLANEFLQVAKEAQAAYYRRTAIWWVISAKQEETRLKRLGKLISNSEAGKRV